MNIGGNLWSKRGRKRVAIIGAFGLFVAVATMVGLDRQRVVAEPRVVEIGMYTEGSEQYFDPIGIWVEPGTTIRFILKGGQHTVTAYHPDYKTTLRIPKAAKPFNSGVLTERGAVFEITLTEEGVYDYFCIPHEWMGMVGRIVVGDPKKSPAAPIQEIKFQPARDMLPSVEEIMQKKVIRY